MTHQERSYEDFIIYINGGFGVPQRKVERDRAASATKDTGGRFMDTTAPRIKVSPDLARESLIAISQLNPDKNLSAPKLLLGNAKNCNGVAVNESDIDEDYRSKLISISYTRSPDSEKIPTLPGNLLD